MSDDLRTRIAEALRKAAHDCPGDCGKSEEECVDAHPIQVEVLHFGQVSVIGGPVEKLAEVVMAVVEAEQAEYEETVVGGLNGRVTRAERRAERAEDATARVREYCGLVAEASCRPHARETARDVLDLLDGRGSDTAGQSRTIPDGVQQ